MAIIARMTRSSMLEVLSLDYVRTARAKGLEESRVVLKHAFRNALVPVVTIGGLQFGQLWRARSSPRPCSPGPASDACSSTRSARATTRSCRAPVLLIAVTFILINIAVDLLYGLHRPEDPL
jgi:ABC-type dipeptide/oligopeptide/nickel transport system permease component